MLHSVYVFDIFENRIDLFQFKLVNLSDNFDLSISDTSFQKTSITENGLLSLFVLPKVYMITFKYFALIIC